jgi:hypothetical protein
MYIHQGEGPMYRLNTRTKQWLSVKPDEFCERWHGAVCVSDDDYTYFAGGTNSSGDEVLRVTRLKCSEDDAVTAKTSQEYDFEQSDFCLMRLPLRRAAVNGALVMPVVNDTARHSSAPSQRRTFFLHAGHPVLAFDMALLDDQRPGPDAGWVECAPELGEGSDWMNFVTSACCL